MKPKVEAFQGDWLSGDRLQWYFAAVTRVAYFEVTAPLVDGIEAITGELVSIKAGGEEHLRFVDETETIPLVHAIERVDGAWRLGPLTKLTVPPGRPLVVTLRGFKGSLRPCGMQASERHSRAYWFVRRIWRKRIGFWERHGVLMLAVLFALVVILGFEFWRSR